MSPEMFCDKWLMKFRDTMREVSDSLCLTSGLAGLITICNVASKQFNLLDHFYAQALEHSLTASDFPEEESGLSLDMKSYIWTQIEVMNARVNQFVAASRVRCAVNISFENLQSMKYGKQLGPCRWRDLPLGVRQRLNNIFEARSKMEETGVWPAYEEQ